jgi:hypothetical protein
MHQAGKNDQAWSEPETKTEAHGRRKKKNQGKCHPKGVFEVGSWNHSPDKQGVDALTVLPEIRSVLRWRIRSVLLEARRIG